MEIIAALKQRIKIMWAVIGILVVLLAASSAYNVYVTKTFERKETYYTVPEKEKNLYVPTVEKKRKKVK